MSEKYPAPSLTFSMQNWFEKAKATALGGVSAIQRKTIEGLEAAAVVYERESPGIQASLKDISSKGIDTLSKVSNVIEILEREASGDSSEPTPDSLGITYVRPNLIGKE